MAYDDKRCCKQMEADFCISFSPSSIEDLADVDKLLRKEEAAEIYATKQEFTVFQQEVTGQLDELKTAIEEDIDVKIQNIETSLENKQDKLIPGEGITIDLETNTISATVSSLNWGSIKGSINDQADLKRVLDAKVNLVDFDEMVEDVVQPMIDELQPSFETDKGLLLHNNKLSLVIDDTLNFNGNKLSVNQQVLEDALNNVAAGLKTDIIDEITPTITSAVKIDVNNNLTNNVIPALKGELKTELHDSLHTELHNELAAELKPELHDSLLQELSTQLTNTIIPALKAELTTELQEYIDEAVEEAMASHIQEAIEQAIEDKVPPMIQAALDAWSVNYYDRATVDSLIELADSDDTTYRELEDGE